jgi:hypothetical protein
MKKSLLFAFVAIIIASGCSKDKADVPSYNGEVTINSTKISFVNITFIISGSDTEHNYSIFNTTGDNEFEMELLNPIVGIVPFDDYNKIDIYSGSKLYRSKNADGNFTITKIDGSSISGTFTGTFIENSLEIPISGKFAAEKLSLEF